MGLLVGCAAFNRADRARNEFLNSPAMAIPSDTPPAAGDSGAFRKGAVGCETMRRTLLMDLAMAAKDDEGMSQLLDAGCRLLDAGTRYAVLDYVHPLARLRVETAAGAVDLYVHRLWLR